MVLFTSQHWRVYLQAAKTPPDVYFSIAQLNPLVAQPPATNRSTLVPLTVSLFPSKRRTLCAAPVCACWRYRCGSLC